MGRFDGKVVVVTGAAGGIGRATAVRLATEGARLVLVDLGGDALEAARTAVDEAGGEALAVAADVTRAAVEAMCDNDPRRFRSIKARFAAPVMPGETIVTDMWRESPTDIIVRARVKERDVEVVKNARVVVSA